MCCRSAERSTCSGVLLSIRLRFSVIFCRHEVEKEGMADAYPASRTRIVITNVFDVASLSPLEVVLCGILFSENALY